MQLQGAYLWIWQNHKCSSAIHLACHWSRPGSKDVAISEKQFKHITQLCHWSFATSGHHLCWHTLVQKSQDVAPCSFKQGP